MLIDENVVNTRLEREAREGRRRTIKVTVKNQIDQSENTEEQSSFVNPEDCKESRICINKDGTQRQSKIVREELEVKKTEQSEKRWTIRYEKVVERHVGEENRTTTNRRDDRH